VMYRTRFSGRQSLLPVADAWQQSPQKGFYRQ
jgi:hypothetical protein